MQHRLQVFNDLGGAYVSRSDSLSLLGSSFFSQEMSKLALSRCPINLR